MEIMRWTHYFKVEKIDNYFNEVKTNRIIIAKLNNVCLSAYLGNPKQYII